MSYDEHKRQRRTSLWDAALLCGAILALVVTMSMFFDGVPRNTAGNNDPSNSSSTTVNQPRPGTVTEKPNG